MKTKKKEGVNKLKKGIFSIALICTLCGLFLTWQLNSLNTLDTNPINQKNQALVALINKLESEIEGYQNQLHDLRSELEDIENSVSQEETDLKILQEQLHKAKLKAGLLPVEGKGIVITLDDNKAGLTASPNEDPNRFLIHYENILNLVTELKQAGAEAISVNEQRIVSSSEIRCVGNVILINTTRLAPPFEIKVLGNPELLEDKLLHGEYDLLKSLGFPVNYKMYLADTYINIPAYSGTYQFNYAQISQ